MPFAPGNRNNKHVKIYFENLINEDSATESAPTIVMHHGDGNTSDDWKTLGHVDMLLKLGYRVILIDYIGFGKSDKSIHDPKAYTIPLLAADTISVLKHIGLTKQDHIIFFGGSMGGTVGYEVATNPDFSDYFEGFIINGMGPKENTLIQIFGQWAADGGMENVVEQMKGFMAEPFPPAVEASFLGNDVKTYIAANTNPWPEFSAEKLATITKPMLLICGSESDERNDVERAAKIIGNELATLTVLPGMDHGQAYWDSKLVVPLVHKFLITRLGIDPTVSRAVFGMPQAL